jgi:HSP20 family molecular chaperone IbpA
MEESHQRKTDKIFQFAIFAPLLIVFFLLGILNFNAQTTYAKGTDQATKEYNAAVTSYNSAVSRLNAAERKTPSFYISGEITRRYNGELLIWGYASNSNASPSHPGWLLNKGNIIIKSYNSSNINYNYYYGRHYFIKQTTGIGIFGQTVPVNVYGPTPSKIKQLQNQVNAAAKKVREKKLKLPAEFSITYKGKTITDNRKHPLKLDGVPFTVNLSNKSKGAESYAWYTLDSKKKWMLISTSKSPSVSISTEKATFKLVINHNKKNYKIHTVYISLPATGFKDIPKTHWAAKSIIKVTKSGLMKDYKDGKFHPTTSVTRGQFAKLIVQAYKISTVKPAIPSFTDVSKSNPNYAYIEATKYYFTGSISTSKGARFNPNQKLRRDEAAAVITRLTLLDRQSISSESFLKQRFTDYKNISPSLYKHVALAVNKNLILGFSNRTFKPSSSLDRANAAYMVYKTTEQYYNKRGIAKFSSTIPALTYKNELPVSLKLSGNAKIFVNNKQVSFDYYGESSQSYQLTRGEGTYHFIIQMVQPFKITEWKKTVVYKIPLPEIKVNALPVDTDKQTLTLSGSVTDKLDEYPKLYINNKETYASYNGTWSEDFELNEGNNTFVIKAVNSSGKMTTIVKVVKFTPKAPALTVYQVSESTTSDSVIISGKVSDKNDPYPKVYINDQEVDVYYDGAWSKTFTLTEGDNTFVVKAENDLGKSTRVTKVINFSPDTPVLSVYSMPATTDLDSVTISGKVSDKNDQYPKVYINDQEVDVYYDGAWSKTFTLTEGDNTFVIKAENDLGKSTSVTKVISFSPDTPVLSVYSMPATTDLDSITISGKVSDKNDQYSKVYINDQEVDVYYDGAWSKTFTLTEGDNTFVIKAENDLGKSSIVTKVVEFLPNPPNITVYSTPASTNYDTVTISGIVSDKNDQFPNVYINNQKAYVNYDGTFSEDFQLASGNNTFVIEVENYLGKKTSVTRNILYLK